MRPSRFQLFAFALVFVMSCQHRGCSLESTVYSKEKDELIGQDKYTVFVSLNERSHYKKLRRTDTGYSISIGMKKNGKELPETIYMGRATGETDPATYLEEAFAEATPDGFTFRLICRDKVMYTYHDIEGHFFLSPYGNDGAGHQDTAQAEPAFGAWEYKGRPKSVNVPLAKYPSLEQFTNDLIEGKTSLLQGTEKTTHVAIANYLEQLHLSEAQLIALFGQFPNPLSLAYFKGEKVKKLAQKHPRWLDTVRTIIGSKTETIGFDRDEMEEFVYVHLQDPYLVHQKDSIYWSRNEKRPIYWTNAEWITNRINCKVPFLPVLDAAFKETIDRGMNDFPRNMTGIHLPSMVRLLHFYHDKVRLEKLAQACVLEENIHQSSVGLVKDIDEIVTYFNQNDQKKIATVFLGKLEQFSFSEKKEVVNFSARILGCDHVKQVVRAFIQKHGDDDAFWLRIDPENCR